MLRSGLDRAFARYARTGDPAALGRVFDGSAAELYRIGYHLLGDRHAAEDLVQQTFVVAIEQAKAFDGARRVLPWLCGILTNRALHLRRQLRHRGAVVRPANGGDVVDPVAEVASREVEERVAATVRSLPEPYRQVLLLHLVHELAPKDVAEALARPDATVRTQLARGLELLRKALPVGIGRLAAGQVPPPIGLAAVRAFVLAKAGTVAVVAASGSAGAVGITFLGVAMKKLLGVVAVLFAAWCTWSWWLSQPAMPPNVDALRMPADAVAQSAPFTPPTASSPAGEEPRVSVAQAVDATTAGLEVRVMWHDGTPAADIAVRCRPRPIEVETWLRAARTDEHGVARFDRLPLGPANVLTGRGTTVDVELVAGSPQRVTITMARGIDVRGRVVDVDERPIAGATVWLSVASMSDDSEPAAVTAPDGAFSIRAAGEHFTLTASAPGFGSAKEAWVEGSDVLLTLRPTPGVLNGIVVDARGEPVRDARVLVGVAKGERGGNQRFFGKSSGQDLWPSRFHRTDAEGRFQAAGLPPIPWPVWVGAPGFAPSWQEVRVRADGPTEVTIRLTAGATVRGRVTDGEGRPVPGAEVRVHPRLPRAHVLLTAGVVPTLFPLLAMRFATTDTNGCYVIPRVLVAPIELTASHGDADTRLACELTDAQVFDWDPVLAPPAEQPTLHGVLVDEAGEPLAGWRMRVGDARDAGNREVPFNVCGVQAGGVFRSNPVTPGRHPILVQPDSPSTGAEVAVGHFDVAACPLRVVVPRAHVPTSRLRGRILLPPGIAATRCHVWVLAPPGLRTVRVRCDDQGDFVAGPVQRGSYRLLAECEAFGMAVVGTCEVVDGRDTAIGPFQVPLPGTLVVHCVDPAGRRVPDAWVHVRPLDADALAAGLESLGLQHRDGTARGPLPAGRWVVHTSDTAPFTAMAVDVRAGETTEVRLVIPVGVPFVLRVPAAPRYGRVQLEWRDAGGAAVRIHSVHPSGTAQDLPFSAPPGRYTLQIATPDGSRREVEVDLRGGETATIVELPLPERAGNPGPVPRAGR